MQQYGCFSRTNTRCGESCSSATGPFPAGQFSGRMTRLGCLVVLGRNVKLPSLGIVQFSHCCCLHVAASSLGRTVLQHMRPCLSSGNSHVHRGKVQCGVCVCYLLFGANDCKACRSRACFQYHPTNTLRDAAYGTRPVLRVRRNIR